MSTHGKALEAEYLLTNAERTGDADALASLLADEFIGIDARGRRVNKTAFIENMCYSGIRFIRLEIEDVQFRSHGSTVIANGRSKFEIETPKGVFSATAQYLDTWQEGTNGLKLIASSVTLEQGA